MSAMVVSGSVLPSWNRAFAVRKVLRRDPAAFSFPCEDRRPAASVTNSSNLAARSGASVNIKTAVRSAIQRAASDLASKTASLPSISALSIPSPFGCSAAPIVGEAGRAVTCIPAARPVAFRFRSLHDLGGASFGTPATFFGAHT